MKDVNRIFVYGTLMSGFLKNVLPHSKLSVIRKTKGSIQARLFDLGSYPGARPTIKVEKRVRGEVYEIRQAEIKNVLAMLDEYEDYHPGKPKESLYLRRIVTVATSGGKTFKSWVYWYNGPVTGKTEIMEGDYKKYLTRNKHQICP